MDDSPRNDKYRVFPEGFDPDLVGPRRRARRLCLTRNRYLRNIDTRDHERTLHKNDNVIDFFDKLIQQLHIENVDDRHYTLRRSDHRHYTLRCLMENRHYTLRLSTTI